MPGVNWPLQLNSCKQRGYGEVPLEFLHHQKTKELSEKQMRILTYLFVCVYLCEKKCSGRTSEMLWPKKFISDLTFSLFQCHLLVQTILFMRIMCQPESLPYHQKAVLELTTQKDNRHSTHGEYFELFLLFFFLIGDLIFQRNSK